MTTPKLSRTEAETIIVREMAKHPELQFGPQSVYLLGIRGYYRDTMGEPRKNDRGIYDDAMFVVSPHAFAAFNANTDPSVFRPGIASLVPGVHLYRKGKHGMTRPGGGYPAFRPATKDEQLPVTRDGQPGTSMGVAINIHRGGRNSTSSLGCQTIHPDQWDAFQSLAYAELDRASQRVVPYVLADGIDWGSKAPPLSGSSSYRPPSPPH